MGSQSSLSSASIRCSLAIAFCTRSSLALPWVLNRSTCALNCFFSGRRSSCLGRAAFSRRLLGSGLLAGLFAGSFFCRTRLACGLARFRHNSLLKQERMSESRSMETSRQENRHGSRDSTVRKGHAFENGLEPRIAPQRGDAGIYGKPSKSRLALVERLLELVARTGLVSKGKPDVCAVPMTEPDSARLRLLLESGQSEPCLLSPARAGQEL